MKLEVGMYVRLKSGYIGKILNVKGNLIETNTIFIISTFPQDFVKVSYNIIDILEVGDYVNGLKVDGIQNGQLLNYNSYDGWVTSIASHSEDIKSIVTHEQMEQIAYKVGE